MSFSDAIAEMSADAIEEVGDPAVFEPVAGPSAQTFAILDEATALVGDLGQILDKRPSIKLLRSVAGEARKGFVTMLGRRFKIEQPVAGGDDAFVVHRFVSEVPA